MSALKLLSEYYSDDMKRRAAVALDLTTKKIRVTTVSDTGTAFTTIFDGEDDAEQFAEDWVKPL
jgi:hypothetical protein